MVALSPAGNRVAFLGTHGGTRQLFLRDLDSLEAKPIPGTEGAFCTPIFSPDGQWLAFYAQGSLKKVSLQGGAPITLASINGMLGASWGTDDSIVFGNDVSSSISKVSAAGGTPQNITHVDPSKGEGNHRYPFLLPGAKAMLFAVGLNGRGNEAQIAVQRLDTSERKVLVQSGTYPSYVPTGHLVYIREGEMMAVPFDRGRLEVTGAPVPLSEAVRQSGQGAAQFGLSALGSLVYVPGVPGRAEGNTLGWVDRKGDFQPLAAPPRVYFYPRLSPDGRQIAVSVAGLKTDVWVYDIQRSTMTRLTFDGNNNAPLWTPDGKRILFLSNQAGAANLFWKTADGTGSDEQITQGEHFAWNGSVSPDGKLAFYSENHPTQSFDLWVVPLGGDPRGTATEGRKPNLFLQTSANENYPTISPDGRWVAYVSNESGRFEIYVRPFPGPGGKWQVSTEGGAEPVWARNGRELFFRSADKMMAVEVNQSRDREGAVAFSASAPRLLFEKTYMRSPIAYADYDVSPDGQRFLMVREGGNEPPPPQINVVLNWFEELKRRVPAA